MNPPRLDRRITIQTRSSELATDGSSVNTWSDTATVWAQLKDTPPGRRGESFASSQHSDTMLTEFTVRYRADMTGAERISYAGAYYNLIGIPAELGRREYLVITCEKGLVK